MPIPISAIVGGVTIAYSASTELTQSYETLGGESLRRTLNGSGVKQTAWTKLRTVLRGSGRHPAGLDSLDYSGTLSLACIRPRDVYSATTTVVLPAARRSDIAPVAFAIVDGLYVRTPYSLPVNTATLTTVAGAVGYVMYYFPLLTVYASAPRNDYDARGILLGWELSAEEA